MSKAQTICILLDGRQVKLLPLGLEQPVCRVFFVQDGVGYAVPGYREPTPEEMESARRLAAVNGVAKPTIALGEDGTIASTYEGDALTAAGLLAAMLGGFGDGD